ncbi:MAG: efflux transporter outer rane subunit [Rhizobium sp.]|nr:efflux transporter outer rane subunit [Rhizobium sp.]
MKKTLLLIAVGSLLSACNSNYVPGPNVRLEPNYKYHKQKPNLRSTMAPETKWWANFSDPTLNSLVEEALASNLSIEQARERIRSARFSARIVKGNYFPTVNGALAATAAEQTVWNRNTAPGQKRKVVTDTSSSSATLSAIWNLDFGARPSAEQQRALVEAQKEVLNETRLDIIAGMAAAYVTAQGLGREIAIAQKSLAVQNNTADITKAKLEAGSVSALDSTRAIAAAALTAADIPALQQEREQAINQIAILLGKEPAAVSNVFTKYRPIRFPRVKFSEGIPADLLSNRPDVRVAEWQLKAAMAGIGVAEADQYPSLTLSGTVRAQANVGTKVASWGFGPSINIPIFQGGRIKANINLSKSDARLQYLQYRQTILFAVQDVEDALIAVRSEQTRHSRLSVAVAELTKAESLARQLNESGTTEFKDVLDAQSALYSAQLQLAISALQVQINYVALCQSLGGGWYGDEPVMKEDTIKLAN